MQTKSWVLGFCQYSRLIIEYNRLIHVISRFILRPSRLVSGQTDFFSGSVFSFKLDSSFLSSETVIVRIDEACIGLGEFYGL